MSGRPILFSAPMVRAILAGAKTQTRRVVALKQFGASDTPGYDWTFRDKSLRWHDVSTARLLESRCIYGVAGDRLWVRETFAKRADCEDGSEKAKHYLCYRADRSPGEGELRDEWHHYGKWRPSIYMPRWASRITLQVESVRVERLQDITDGDALREGVADPGINGDVSGDELFPVQRFQKLWDSINGKRAGCSWADNPWVWVVSFSRVTTEAPDGPGGRPWAWGETVSPCESYQVRQERLRSERFRSQFMREAIIRTAPMGSFINGGALLVPIGWRWLETRSLPGEPEPGEELLLGVRIGDGSRPAALEGNCG